jgi:hypothetical protein
MILKCILACELDLSVLGLCLKMGLDTVSGEPWDSNIN